jgi:hypothetical protein
MGGAVMAVFRRKSKLDPAVQQMVKDLGRYSAARAKGMRRVKDKRMLRDALWVFALFFFLGVGVAFLLGGIFGILVLSHVYVLPAPALAT